MKYVFAILLTLTTMGAHADLNWDEALNGAQRSEENRARDTFRHPRETLEFFGLKSSMTVLEVSPGGGWYTELLAPLVIGDGTLYAAHFSLNPPNPYYRNSLGKFLQKLAATPDRYNGVIVTQLQAPEELAAAPAGSVDLALTFRNIHSWMRGDVLDPTLKAIYSTLKPGGKFGVVQHRAKPGTSVEDMAQSGYVTEEHMIKAAEAAGFVLVKRSEINANPKDTADYPKGVWTLPPTLRGDDANREHYLEIGESDRMTLLFARPSV